MGFFMNEELMVIKRKAQFYKDKNICVHISKKIGWIHNGFIKEISSDFLILDDEREGEMPIFFLEIKEIEKRKLKEENGN